MFHVRLTNMLSNWQIVNACSALRALKRLSRGGICIIFIALICWLEQKFKNFYLSQWFQSFAKVLTNLLEITTHNQLQSQKCQLATEFGQYFSHKTVLPTAYWISSKYSELFVFFWDKFFSMKCPWNRKWVWKTGIPYCIELRVDAI